MMMATVTTMMQVQRACSRRLLFHPQRYLGTVSSVWCRKDNDKPKSVLHSSSSARSPYSHQHHSTTNIQTTRRPFHSSSILSSSSSSFSVVDRIGLGGHKWSSMEPAKYQQIVQTALEQGISTIEAGQEGGDAALADAYRACLQANSSLKDKPVTFLLRLGYRTVVRGDNDDNNDNKNNKLVFPGDVVLEQQQKQQQDDANTTSSSPAHDEQATTTTATKDAAATVDVSQRDAVVVHNMGRDYLVHALQTSPLVELHTNDDEFPNTHVVAMLHNPEVQASSVELTEEERQHTIRDQLVQAFQVLEDQVQEQKTIQSYGVVSNGLCLPTQHPLHLSWKTVLEAAQQVAADLGHLNLSVMELPVNLLETTGMDVAKDIREYIVDASTKLEADAPDLSSLQVYAMRPLTCYPDCGTGTGHPIVLADYQLPATMEKTLTWTHEMQQPPALYDVALKSAMSHFDAQDILQAKVQGRELTTEERETLDGCKLLQSLLHDVDAGLEKVRSFQAHEEELYQKIIPLIHDTFESYDEDTANVLQSFFGAYSMAVQFAIARNTRKLLQQGEEGSNIPVYDDLEPTMRLQEYGLRYVFKEDNGAISKVIVGCTEPQEVIDDIAIVRRVLEEGSGDTSNAGSGDANDDK